MKYIDTEKFSRNLRKKGIDLTSRKILLTNFLGSEQEKDLTLRPNCEGFGRIHHFYRKKNNNWPSNPLPIDPALYALGKPPSDMIKVQVFQNAICSWRCWYCFVDNQLLSANPKFSYFKSADELLDIYMQEKVRPPIIDISGGQPDLVPELGLWFADSIHKRNLSKSIYLWSDDNLSNDYLWRFLSTEEIKRLASYNNYGRVGCFKGFDKRSFSFNTSADPDAFSLQFILMRRLIVSGFDVYGYITLTSDIDKNIEQKIIDFIDRLQHEVHELFPLRTIPLQIFEFSPTRGRMTQTHRRAMEIQKIAVDIWQVELSKRFSHTFRSRPIYGYSLK